jgi:peptide/nickel transport system substrate-binding protein
MASPIADAILQMVLPSAVSFGEDYIAEPVLLTSLPNAEDGTLRRNEDGTIGVTLHYRDDLRWSDGEPFTAADALFGIRALPASPYGPAFMMLDVQQVDDYTLALTLADGAEYPYTPPQPPLPLHHFEAGDDPVALFQSGGYPVLTDLALGPYMITEWVASSHVLLHTNPQYPAPALMIPAVRIRFLPDAAQIVSELQGGGCDVALDEGMGFEQYPALLAVQEAGLAQVYVWSGPVWDQVILNTYPVPFSGRVPYFADARVRQAIAYTVDRAGLAGQLWGGVTPPLDSWLPSDHWAYTTDGLIRYSLDVATATALLDQAGWHDQDGDGIREYHGAGGTYTCQRGNWSIEEGTPFTPMLIIPAGDSLRAQMADRVRADLAAVGIGLQVQQADPMTLFSPAGPLARRDFDMALLASVTRPDPGGVAQWVGADVFLHPLERVPVHFWQLEERWTATDQLVERLAFSNIPDSWNDYQGQNYSGWCNEAADIAVVEAVRRLNLSERMGFYAQQQALFTAEIPVLPLSSRPRLAAAAPYVCGLRPGPYDALTWNISDWTMDQSGACEQ